MCTIVMCRRPGTAWPFLMAANRDEMLDRPWRPPARHWPDRPRTIAGLDQLAGGTWMGLNDKGVSATIANRRDSLGPAPGYQSRGGLVLLALDHASAAAAVAAIQHLDLSVYRSFNLVIADADEAFWLRHRGNGDRLDVSPVAKGVSMLTAGDMNDPASPRIRRYLPLFSAAVPSTTDERPDWRLWQTLLARRDFDAEEGPAGAMTVVTAAGFGTVCSSLLALPATDGIRGRTPLWDFADGPPDRHPFRPLPLKPLK